MLLEGDRPVRLGSRAFDVLNLLVSNPGRVLTKQEIMDAVWPDTVVVEANLSVHMAALRRALGNVDNSGQYIITVPGRGYRFASRVDVVARTEGFSAAKPIGNLPLLLTHLIGRDANLADIGQRLRPHRLLTIVGSGGVGKTALALNAAEAQLPKWKGGVWLVDFATFSDPELVPTALATVLGLEVRSTRPIPSITSAIANRELLLVFDNCEHLLEHVAALAHAILQSTRSVGILATSREPLTVPGEQIQRLEPLDVPPESMPIGAEEALAYPSIQLLSERVCALNVDFVLRDEEALAASLICRKLGGVPLAIEFASALIPSFGVVGLASRLDDRLRLLRTERRATLSRHRTLAAALDWSYQLLDETEKLVLRRLSVFSGGFTIESAAAVVPDPDQQIDLAATVATLVLKSLIAPDLRDSQPRFRLLETTRAFALSLLTESFEQQEVGQRHAVHISKMLKGKEGPSPHLNATAFLPELDNIRSALNWSLSESGDLALAASIAAESLPVWFGLSLLTECGARMQVAFSKLTQGLRESSEGQAIHGAITSTEIFTSGTADASYRDWMRKGDAAEASKDGRARVRLLVATWTFNIRLPDYPAADEQSRMFEEIALSSNSANLKASIGWMRGTTLHHMGRLGAARAHFEQFIRDETAEFRAYFMSTTGFDRRSDAFGLLGLTKCMQGHVEEGLRDVETGVSEARSTQKALPLCEALQWSIAARLISAASIRTISCETEELYSTAEQHSLSSHLGMALCYKGCAHSLQQKHASAAKFLEAGLDRLKKARYGPFDPLFVAVLGSVRAAIGQVREGLRAMESFESDQQYLMGFGRSDFLRRKARLKMLIGAFAEAEGLLREAESVAADQGVAVWVLRAATDLAEFLHGRGRIDEASDNLRKAIATAPTGLQGPHRRRAQDLLALWN
ncbi:ATP-binding protein [Bradyrhizobium sp. 33ap4]|uniref:ATP-binding protein n=1 Tax=Bradyrhizobium sp. 33ap4 TaxID=3061630 RepID=UPI00292E189C|nr:winged helix-turn-helix domain-containing protein [Bradyrhizobium sp. 33ap4]